VKIILHTDTVHVGGGWTGGGGRLGLTGEGLGYQRRTACTASFHWLPHILAVITDWHAISREHQSYATLTCGKEMQRQMFDDVWIVICILKYKVGYRRSHISRTYFQKFLFFVGFHRLEYEGEFAKEVLHKLQWHGIIGHLNMFEVQCKQHVNKHEPDLIENHSKLEIFNITRRIFRLTGLFILQLQSSSLIWMWRLFQ